MPASLRFVLRPYFQILLGGMVLFFVTEQALKITGDPNFFPTVILLGAFMVPVAFVAYFYGQEQALDVGTHIKAPVRPAMFSFLIGGVLGVTVAGILEYATLNSLGIFALFGVGLIEESAKLIVPVVIFLRWRYHSEIDGLLFGVASGMGFAALETMGYGLVALIKSQGNIGVLEETLLVRGLFSPVGHAAWTGLVCAVLWRERGRTGRLLSAGVIGVFVLAIVLHASWDLVSSSNLLIVVFPGYLIIGGISLTLLIRRLREARRLSAAGQLGTSAAK